MENNYLLLKEPLNVFVQYYLGRRLNLFTGNIKHSGLKFSY